MFYLSFANCTAIALECLLSLIELCWIDVLVKCFFKLGCNFSFVGLITCHISGMSCVGSRLFRILINCLDFHLSRLTLLLSEINKEFDFVIFVILVIL